MSVTNPSQVLEATEGFVCEIDGERFIVNRRQTRISADHLLARHYPNYFRPVEQGLSFRVEEATDVPGAAPRQSTVGAPVRTDHNPPAADSKPDASRTAAGKATTTKEK